MTLPIDTKAYFDALVARASLSVVVPQMQVAHDDDQFNRCHENATKWVAEHPEYTVVRGWLLWPQAGPPYLLHAHSIVRGPQGLVDVTPLRDPGLHFLEHKGSEAEFLWLARHFAQFTHGLDFSLGDPRIPPQFDN
jgi:hypothetical protein